MSSPISVHDLEGCRLYLSLDIFLNDPPSRVQSNEPYTEHALDFVITPAAVTKPRDGSATLDFDLEDGVPAPWPQ